MWVQEGKKFFNIYKLIINIFFSCSTDWHKFPKLTVHFAPLHRSYPVPDRTTQNSWIKNMVLTSFFDLFQPPSMRCSPVLHLRIVHTKPQQPNHFNSCTVTDIAVWIMIIGTRKACCEIPYLQDILCKPCASLVQALCKPCASLVLDDIAV